MPPRAVTLTPGRHRTPATMSDGGDNGPNHADNIVRAACVAATIRGVCAAASRVMRKVRSTGRPPSGVKVSRSSTKRAAELSSID